MEIKLLIRYSICKSNIWGKVFKNGRKKICGRQPLKNFKSYGLLRQRISLQIFKRLSSTNFTWSILEYFAPYINNFSLTITSLSFISIPPLKMSGNLWFSHVFRGYRNGTLVSNGLKKIFPLY